MKKGKNFFYRVNPESVLSELTSIDHDQWLNFFLNFFHDLRADDPDKARNELTSKIISEAHGFRQKRSLAGKASAEQRATSVEHMLTNVEQVCSDVQPVAVAVTEAITIKDKVKRFVPPSIEEVTIYCSERNNNVDPQKFHDHYETRNWIPKGYTKQMSNWKAAVRTWEGNDIKNKSSSQSTFEDMKIDKTKQAARDFVEEHHGRETGQDEICGGNGGNRGRIL